MKIRIHSIVISKAILLILISTIGSFGQATTGLSDVARTYLQEALDILEKNSVNRNRIDWESFRQLVFEKAEGAKLPVDTYSAIRFALRELKDGHSYLQLPAELRKEELERNPNSSDQRFFGEFPPMPYASRTEVAIDSHRLGRRVVARLVIPKSKGAANVNALATRLQSEIEAFYESEPCAWIVDLRGNTGGNMWGMLAGVGPLLGKHEVGYFEGPNGERSGWFYDSGRAGLSPPNGEAIVLAEVSEPIKEAPDTPVAVLIDKSTASSGEAIAVSFRGRARTRFFGERTMGLSTANQGFRLSDGANIVLTVGIYLDSNGTRYPNGIEADEHIPVGEKAHLPTEDPIIHAALGWLSETENCSEV